MTKARGVLIVLILAGALWAISLASWQAGVDSDTLGPAGVANLAEAPSDQASPVTTSCVAVIAVCGLLTAMMGKAGRFVVLGIAALAAAGYTFTALSAMGRPGATGWPVFALTAGIAAVIVLGCVIYASAGWTNSNRYARSAEAGSEEFDPAATWDALSRGDEIEVSDSAADPDGSKATDSAADPDIAEDPDGSEAGR